MMQAVAPARIFARVRLGSDQVLRSWRTWVGSDEWLSYVVCSCDAAGNSDVLMPDRFIDYYTSIDGLVGAEMAGNVHE